MDPTSPNAGAQDPDRLGELEARLSYAFDDPAVLERALTHRSYANEVAEWIGDNQRLEFLGDAVLGLVVAGELFGRDRQLQEGALSTRQARIVCEPTLADAARNLELGRYLRLGRGEDTSGGRDKDSLLADAFEAVVAALYLDGGLEAAAGVLTEQLAGAFDGVEKTAAPSDFKSRLQTLVQRDRDIQPDYRIIDESGPDHERRFVAEVSIGSRPAGSGRGRTKKAAEQQAARDALNGKRFK